MEEGTARRIRDLYGGTAGALWTRIEAESPSSYWEENVVEGRREILDLLLAWMRPARGLAVLDAGCGSGGFARRIAGAGARVTGIDIISRFPSPGHSTAGETNPVFRTGDFLPLLKGSPAIDYDAILLSHVLEDYSLEEQCEILAAAAATAVPSLFLIFRVGGLGLNLLSNLWPESIRKPIEPIPLLRWVHLNTPLRLTRQRLVRRRNYRAQISEFTRSDQSVSGP